MFTDPISDMLTRIRNAQMARKTEVLVPLSKIKFEIAKLLKHEDYIVSVEEVKQGNMPNIKIILKYDSSKPAISHIQRVSTPGRRVYVKKEAVPTILNGLGMAILSTPQGLMTNKQAKRAGVGGELMCEVW